MKTGLVVTGGKKLDRQATKAVTNRFGCDKNGLDFVISVVFLTDFAGVLELVDRPDLKSVGGIPVGVQVPPPAPLFRSR